MALQEAATAKASAEANKPSDGPIFTSSIVGYVDGQISSASSRGEFLYNEDFNGRMVDGESQIQQPDKTYVSCDDFTNALNERGYQVSMNAYTERDKTLFLRLKVWWG